MSFYKSFFDWINEVFDGIVTTIQNYHPTYNPSYEPKKFEGALTDSVCFELWQQTLRTIDIGRQDNPLQADSIKDKEYGTLEQWGLTKIGREPFSESGGEYLVEFEGTGDTFEAGEKFTNSATGFQYTLKERTTVNSGGNADRVNLSMNTNLNGINVRLVMSAETAKAYGTVKGDTGGFRAALKPGDLLSANSPKAGINNPSRVIEVIKDPTENESITEYRDDVLLGFRVPPRGGARGDYLLWGERVSGVRRVYPYAGDDNDTLGALWILIESTFSNGVATPELLDAVLREYDENIPLSDAGIILETVAVETYTIFVEGFTGVEPSKEDEAKNSIKNSLDIYIKNLKPFIDGVDRTTERNDRMLRIELTAITQDNVNIYGGFISDVYWNLSEFEKELTQGTVFRLGNVVYV